MDHSFKVAISRNQWGLSYRGFGRGGRQYSIHKHKNHFTASLISGEGQPITAMGRSPMEAVARAESLQEGECREAAGGRWPCTVRPVGRGRDRQGSEGQLLS
jgi:hypothetical protein